MSEVALYILQEQVASLAVSAQTSNPKPQILNPKPSTLTLNP